MMPGKKSKQPHKNGVNKSSKPKNASSVKKQRLQLPDSDGQMQVANSHAKAATTSPSFADAPECTSPSSTFCWLVSPHEPSDFFSTYWEKEPLVIRAEPSTTRCHELFTKEALLQLLRDENLKFVTDVNMCRFLNGKWESLNKVGRCTSTQFCKLFEHMGATMQFHHPQRFVAKLWAIMEKLESYFGCLVGANVYLTPRGCQGLAPHYDDVEVFVLQLEGEKLWTLCKPPVPLAREYKTNLTPEEIGSPTHKVTLKPGDVLYMPRGTVHQASTPSTYNGHSTHITFSTYQKHTWGDYMQHAFPKLLEAAINDCSAWRQGLPRCFFTNPVIDTEFLQSLLKELPRFATSLDPQPPYHLMQDFMNSRLPPYGLIRNDVIHAGPEGTPPNLNSSVSLTYPDHVSYTLSCNGGEETEDEEEDDGKSPNTPPAKHLFVFTSIFNDRSHHMMKPPTSNDNVSNVLKFLPSYDKAVKQLLTEKRVPVRLLSLGSDQDKLQLTTTLWSLHLLQVFAE